MVNPHFVGQIPCLFVFCRAGSVWLIRKQINLFIKQAADLLLARLLDTQKRLKMVYRRQKPVEQLAMPGGLPLKLANNGFCRLIAAVFWGDMAQQQVMKPLLMLLTQGGQPRLAL